MNRNDEYRALTETLDQPPLKLDFTLDRALLRKKEHARRRRRAIFAPTFSLAGLLAVFVLLVNVLPGFAYAAGRIPLLRELAQFVTLSPSLSAAVENEFVQPVGQELTQEGITARIEYLIVDQKQLNIFYSLDSDLYERMDVVPEIFGTDGAKLEDFSIYTPSYAFEKSGLGKVVVDFESVMPPSLILELKIQDVGHLFAESTPPPEASVEDSMFKDKTPLRETLTSFSFTLSFDPAFTASGEILELNQDFELDGQKLTLISAEIYPTHMRFVFNADEKNTAWLKDLVFYVENEKGERFEGIKNGLSARGDIDTPMMKTYMMESAFFSKSRRLSLHITGAAWLDKDAERVRIDLINQKSEPLPEGVSLVSAKKQTGGWLLEFTAAAYRENLSHQVFGWNYYDAQGKEYVINGMSSSSVGSSYSPDPSQEPDEDKFGLMLPLKDYLYDEVWLCPSHSRYTAFETPIQLLIK